MVNVSKLLVVVGLLLIVLAVVLKLAGTWLVVGTMGVRLASLLVAANSCFLLAILAKK